jgi:hypothetical protein
MISYACFYSFKKMKVGSKWILERYAGGGMDWIHLAQGGDQWRALVNTVMNLRVPQNIKKFLSS